MEASRREMLLKLVEAVPAGRVATYQVMGGLVGASAREAASVLGRLHPDEADALPWHRVVGDQGWLGAVKLDRFGRTQEQRLVEDGLSVVQGQVAGFAAVELTAAELTEAPGEAPLRQAAGG